MRSFNTIKCCFPLFTHNRRESIACFRIFILNFIPGISKNRCRARINPHLWRFFQLINGQANCQCSIYPRINNLLFIACCVTAINRFTNQVYDNITFFQLLYPVTWCMGIPIYIRNIFILITFSSCKNNYFIILSIIFFL
jgi:hypothetical protein